MSQPELDPEFLSMWMGEGFSFKSALSMEKSSQKSVGVAKEARARGNEYYSSKKRDKDVLVKTLFYYTKSVAYSPLDSEELPKAYGNRSALLFYLRKYRECVIDIDLALKYTKCPKLKAMFFCRKAECMKVIKPSLVQKMFLQAQKSVNLVADTNAKKTLVQALEKAKASRPRVSTLMEHTSRDLPQIDSSSEIPGISNKVLLTYDKEERIHYFVAQENIKSGEIMIIDPGLAQTPNFYKLYLSCSYCLKLTWNGIPCNSCALVVYCSESCKLKAWNEFHSMECRKVDFLLSEPFRRDFERFLLVIRLMIKIFKEAETKDFVTYLRHDYRALCRWRSYYEDLDCNDVKTYLALDEYRAWRKQTITPILEEIKQLHDVFNKIFDLKARLDEDLFNFFKNLLVSSQLSTFTIDGYECTCCLPGGEHHGFENKDSCLFSRGLMYATVMNLILHSCHPNADRNFAKGKAYVFSTRPINKGEKLSFSWNVPLFEGKFERNIEIKRKFGQECDCEACTENWKAFTALDKKKAKKAFFEWAQQESRRTNNPDFHDQIYDRPLRHFQGTADYLKSVGEFVDETYLQKNNRDADVTTLHFKYAYRLWSSRYYEAGLEIPEN